MTIEKKLLSKKILFIDIETVPCVPSYNELDDNFKALWDKKASVINKKENLEYEETFIDKAAIFSEFGKVIVIGLGFIYLHQDQIKLRVGAIYGHDESAVLLSFKEFIETNYDQNQLQLCGHNIKEFDVPYLCRRMIVNNIPLPKSIQLSGKKPWEIKHLDTMEMWSFGDRKNFTSLHMLASLFGISSSKELMQGDQVTHTYYIKKDLSKITDYCMQDVKVTAQVFYRLNYGETIPNNNIMILKDL